MSNNLERELPTEDVPDPHEFLIHVSSILESDGAKIVNRWQHRARALGLVLDGVAPHPVALHGPELMRSFSRGLRSDVYSTATLILSGLRFGAATFHWNLSLDQVQRLLDLFMALVLYALEKQIQGEYHGTIRDGIRAARRIHDVFAVLSLSVTRGYTQALNDVMRDRYQLLRHDLRNPLGTIKNALSLMGDSELSAEVQTHRQFRLMAERNTQRLELLIRQRLGEAAATDTPLGHQKVSLRAMMLSVRRDVRTAATHRGVSIVVNSSSASGTAIILDAGSLELMLLALLHAAVAEAAPHEEIHLATRDETNSRVTIVISRAPSRCPVSEQGTLQQLHDLSGALGVTLRTDSGCVLSVPALVPVIADANAPTVPN